MYTFYVFELCLNYIKKNEDTSQIPKMVNVEYASFLGSTGVFNAFKFQLLMSRWILEQRFSGGMSMDLCTYASKFRLQALKQLFSTSFCKRIWPTGSFFTIEKVSLT